MVSMNTLERMNMKLIKPLLVSDLMREKDTLVYDTWASAYQLEQFVLRHSLDTLSQSDWKDLENTLEILMKMKGLRS